MAEATEMKQPEREFIDFLKDGRFMLLRSRSSGRYTYFPRLLVPGSGETDLEWVEASGAGTVHATTVVRQRPPKEDYNVALVDLAEGVRMMTRVVGIDPSDVAIGMEVTASVGAIDEEPAVLFTPAGGNI